MIQDIATLIAAIICLWLGAELLSAGDAPLGGMSIGIGIVVLAIRSDFNRRNVKSRRGVFGDSLAWAFIGALVFLVVVLMRG